MTDEERERFDGLLQDVIDELPDPIRDLVEEVPVVVEDHPAPELVRSLIQEGTLEAGADGKDLCGLHSGIGLTERSVDDGMAHGGVPGAPEQVMLFREGIVSLAFADEENGGFEGAKPGSWSDPDADERVYEEIRITLLHEIGHHFGLDETDLDRLGYA